MKEIPSNRQEEYKGLVYFEIFNRRGIPNCEYRHNRGLPQETKEELQEVRKQLIEETRKMNKGKRFKNGGMWL